MENWLVMLLTVYQSNASNGLAQTISFYLDKLLQHEDIHFCGDKRCDYIYPCYFKMQDSAGIRNAFR
ncbi:hypothetical protein [Colwellia sp. MT2012]|uniref:hypothetical protein n=1 Tax=Colwellia sp. MT2012 TaxID=1718921 RepID=UPI00070B7A7D|nr:hypothetical protein [Colwellia sp. MT2012]